MVQYASLPLTPPFLIGKKCSNNRMPRINDQILDSIIYLYPSSEAAKQGIAAGDTGFLVSVLLMVSERIPQV